MVTATELVKELYSVGAILAADGIEVPKGFWTMELREAVSQHKAVLKLLYRLRLGQRWLTEQNERYLADAEEAASDELFVRGIDKWDRMENDLRVIHLFNGCIQGEGKRCPDESPVSCRACVK